MRTIYIARHGECVANAQRRLPSSDSPLTEKGIEQAKSLADDLVGQGITTIYSSPAARALESAEIIGKRLGLAVVAEESFRDFNFGSYVGRKYDGSDSKVTEQLQQMKNNPSNHSFPRGDSLVDLYRRVVPGLEKIVRENPEGIPLLVSHIYVNRHLIGVLYGICEAGASEIWQPNGCVYIIERGEIRYYLEGKETEGYLKVKPDSI